MPHCVTRRKIKEFFYFGDQNSFPGDLLTTIGRQKATYKKIKLGALGWVEGYSNAHRELALWGFGVMHFTESEQK